MKKILFTVFLVSAAFIKPVYGIPISANLDITPPAFILDNVKVAADFNINGQAINIESLQLLIEFENNILDPLEAFSVSYSNPVSGTLNFHLAFSPGSNLKFNLSDFYIPTNGVSEFEMSATGNGVNISNISLIGEATPVPEPSLFILLFTGLIVFIGLDYRTSLTISLTRPFIRRFASLHSV